MSAIRPGFGPSFGIEDVMALRQQVFARSAALQDVTGAPERLQSLREFLRTMGLSLGGGEMPTAKDYGDFLDSVRGRPDYQLLQTGPQSLRLQLHTSDRPALLRARSALSQCSEQHRGDKQLKINCHIPRSCRQ